MVFLSYPEVKLKEDIIEKLLRFFDLEIGEDFIEIIIINQHKKIINLYFELPSEWARGKKEEVMLSLIMKEEYNSRLIYSFLIDTVHKIRSRENVFKAFYKDNDYVDHDIEIDISYEAIKRILFSCLTKLINKIEADNKIKREVL
jgi:hypothetical protein